MLSRESVERLNRILEHSHALATVYRYKQRLQAIWQERTLSQDGLVRALEEWCREAEESGIRALRLRADAARLLPGAGLAPSAAIAHSRRRGYGPARGAGVREASDPGGALSLAGGRAYLILASL